MQITVSDRLTKVEWHLGQLASLVGALEAEVIALSAASNNARDEIRSFVKAMQGTRSPIVRDQVIDLWLAKWSEHSPVA